MWCVKQSSKKYLSLFFPFLVPQSTLSHLSNTWLLKKSLSGAFLSVERSSTSFFFFIYLQKKNLTEVVMKLRVVWQKKIYNFFHLLLFPLFFFFLYLICTRFLFRKKTFVELLLASKVDRREVSSILLRCLF
jgi:hypothetical protein